MDYQTLRPQIATNDILLCKGKSLFSRIIQMLTGPDSHVMSFWRFGDGLFCIGEEEGIGFHVVPASLYISQYNGEVKWGKAPDEVRGKDDLINTFVQQFRSNADMQEYHYGTLPKVLLSDDFGVKINPMTTGAVCSVASIQGWITCGYPNPDKLPSPSDFEKLVTEIIVIDKGV